MGKHFSAIVYGTGIVLAAFLTGCSNPQKVDDEKSDAGTAHLQIVAAKSSPFKQIAKTAVLNISAPDMVTMAEELTVTDSSVEGTIEEIPAGKKRLFEVSVFDSLDTLQYKGSAFAEVFADSAVSISITLYRINGKAVINGKVVDTASDPTPVLVAHWSFDSTSDNTYYDVTGHGYDATATGLSLASGVKGKALDLPGSGFELLAKNSKDNFNLPHFTFETWFISDIDLNEKNMYALLFSYNRINSGIYNGYGVHISPDGKIVAAFANEDDSWVEIASKTAVLPERWYHIVCTYDGSDLSVYIDGELDNSRHCSGAYALPMADAQIGCQTLTDGTIRYHFDGRLDEMKLYRNALSAEVIKATYNELKPGQ